MTNSQNGMAAKVFHPLLALIASASNNELARYVEFLKEENKILRARVPGQIHTRTDERTRFVKLGKALGHPCDLRAEQRSVPKMSVTSSQ